MKQVTLYGDLAEQYGRVHQFDINSPAEAIRALAANFKGFPKDILNHDDGFHVVIDEVEAGEENLAEPFRQEIKIIPVIAGSKSSFFRIITGVALIGASFFMPTTALFSFGTTSLSSIAFGLGFSLALGGVAQLLSPTPKTQAADGSNKKIPSFHFNGAENVSIQGAAVPILYGRMIIGSVVISSGLTTESVVIAAATVASGISVGAVNIKGYTRLPSTPAPKGTNNQPSTTGKF